MKSATKEIIHYSTAVAMLVVGTAFCAWSCAAPPEGEIHSSVLWLMGQIILFAGCIFGVTSYINMEINKRIPHGTTPQKNC